MHMILPRDIITTTYSCFSSTLGWCMTQQLTWWSTCLTSSTLGTPHPMNVHSQGHGRRRDCLVNFSQFAIPLKFRKDFLTICIFGQDDTSTHTGIDTMTQEWSCDSLSCNGDKGSEQIIDTSRTAFHGNWRHRVVLEAWVAYPLLEM